jgi:hypothetical protein
MPKIKMRYSFASLIIKICCVDLRDISILGDPDPILRRAAGCQQYDNLLLRYKLLKKTPQIFPELKKWRVVTPSGESISVWRPVATVCRNIMGIFPPPGHLFTDVTFKLVAGERILRVNLEVADPIREPAQPFLSPHELARLAEIEAGMAGRRRDVADVDVGMSRVCPYGAYTYLRPGYAWVDCTRNAIRVAIFRMLRVDGMAVLCTTGPVNTFIRAHKGLVGFDLRLLSGVVQSATHPYAAFWCLGQMTQSENLRLPEAPNSGRICLARVLDQRLPGNAWHVIKALGPESAFKSYDMQDSDAGFIETFFNDVMEQLSDGYGLFHRPSVLRKEYLPAFGWICAYILLRRVCFKDFGPDLRMEESFYRRMRPDELLLFKEGFDIILNLDTVLANIEIRELCDVLRKQTRF